MNTRQKQRPYYDNYTLSRIAKAITEKSCPICLGYVDDGCAAVITACMHAYCIECIRKWSRVKPKCPLCNVDFNSWFCRINLLSKSFHKEKLLEDEGKRENEVERWRRNQLSQERVIRRSRGELHTVLSRTRPLPRIRSFGRPGIVDPEVIAETIRRWRASIYEVRMQAIPSSSKSCLLQQLAENGRAKDVILQRIEPWIQRKLRAILGDPDPSLIVHVATSLFISMYLKKHAGSSGQPHVEDDFLTPLRRFLRERTDMFWHELRCFAESSYCMEAYDSVVEYKFLD